MKVILDENVSLDIRPVLESLGFEVVAIALLSTRGMSDIDVFAMAQRDKALLITRDRDFTNSIRFPPQQTQAILFLRDGNLRGSDEAGIVRRFLESHAADTFLGKLVSLSPTSTRIR